GPQAVKDFAEKMGIEFTLEETGEIVTGWRDVNPEVVALWAMLNDSLRDIVEHGMKYGEIMLAGGDLVLMFEAHDPPASIARLKPGAVTVVMTLAVPGTGRIIMKRTFQGCFMDGRDICYHKPD